MFRKDSCTTKHVIFFFWAKLPTSITFSLQFSFTLLKKKGGSDLTLMRTALL